MAKIITHLRKMRTTLDVVAQYTLPLYDILENTGMFYMNPLVGEWIILRFENEIHCIATGKKIRKTFSEGLSYDAFLSSPMATPSIIRPELSRIHEGIALRDMAWELEHHNQPHYVYLSKTSDVKVGVMRSTNIHSRWIDQGAVEGIIIAQTPYRQLAGLMEVALKDHFPDKTAWQAMLKNAVNEMALAARKEYALGMLPGDYESFFHDDDEVTHINYPVLRYPEKVKSLKIEAVTEFKGRLIGIRGQYLIFEDGHVFNVRSHAGYRVSIEYGIEESPAEKVPESQSPPAATPGSTPTLF